MPEHFLAPKDKTCERCGLKRGQSGSITQWIFKDTRCACSPVDDETAAAHTQEINSEPTDRDVVERKLVGSLVDGRFRVDALLGIGGWGCVVKAWHPELDCPVAIKLLHPHLSLDSEKVSRFKQEAQAARQLRHPNIVAVHDYGHWDDRPYLVMDFLQGHSLSEEIAAKAPSGITKDRFFEIFEQVLAGLAVAHDAGIVHRDLTPANIFIVEQGRDAGKVKILDFGLAKVISPSGESIAKLTQTGATVGSPAYMSPEHCMGKQTDARSDIYSLGCCMYEALSAHKVFSEDTVYGWMNAHVSSAPNPLSLGKSTESGALKDLVHRCLEKEPDNRPQSAQQLLSALRNLRAGKKAGLARRKLLAFRPGQPGFVISAIAVGAVVGVSLLGAYLNSTQPQQRVPARYPMAPPGGAQSKHVPRWQNKTLDQWTALIESQPTAQNYYNRGSCRVLRNEYSEAASDYSEAIKLNPKFAEAYAELSLLQTSDDQFDLAINSANEAIKLRPTWGHGYFARAYADNASEQTELAIRDCEKAIACGENGSDFEPPHMNVYKTLSTCLINLGRYADAEGTLKEGLNSVPPRYRATLIAQRCFLECARQEFATALTDLDAAMRLEPGARHRWVLKAYALIGSGKLSEAEAVCSAGLQGEAAGGGYRHRADYLRTLGRMDQAIEDYTKAIELDRKQHYYTLYMRGLCYFRNRQFLQSRSDLKLAAKMNPLSGKSLSLLGAVENQLGKTQESQDCFARAFALRTQTPIMFVNRATAELQQSKLESALNDVNRAIEMDPYFKEAFALRAEIAKQQGRPQDASRDAGMAQKLLTHLTQ